MNEETTNFIKENASRLHEFQHEDDAKCGWCNCRTGTTFWMSSSREKAIRELKEYPGEEISGLCGYCMCKTIVGEDGFDPSKKTKNKHHIIAEGDMEELSIEQKHLRHLIQKSYYIELKDDPDIFWTIIGAKDEESAIEEVIEFEEEKGYHYVPEDLIVREYSPLIANTGRRCDK